MSRAWHILRQVPLLAVQFLIRGYQFIISPLLIGNCKFVPSCSDYFLQAVKEWGVVKGSWLGVRRIARCHPFGIGGIDPVPRRKSDSHARAPARDRRPNDPPGKPEA